jgi:hypothetical protein
MEEQRKTVLLVTNSASEEEINQIKEAFSEAQKRNLQIELSLVHVIPTLPTCYFNIPSMVLLAEKYYEEAKQSLTVVGDSLNVSKKNQWLITGKIRNEVLRLAAKLNTSFILASSVSLQDLHKSSFLFKKEQNALPIKSINNTSIWA